MGRSVRSRVAQPNAARTHAANAVRLSAARMNAASAAHVSAARMNAADVAARLSVVPRSPAKLVALQKPLAALAEKASVRSGPGTPG